MGGLVGAWLFLAAAAPDPAVLDALARGADAVVRGEVVQVAPGGGAVTLVVDRLLAGERPPLAVTFAPATAEEGWAVGDRRVVALRARVDAEDGPRWTGSPRAGSPDVAEADVALAVDRHFAPASGGTAAVRPALLEKRATPEPEAGTPWLAVAAGAVVGAALLAFGLARRR